MYHPPDIGTNDNVIDEFIELRNVSATAVALYHTNYTTNTWRLRGSVEYSFAKGTMLAPGDFMLVVGFDPADLPYREAFLAAYDVPGGVMLFGPYAGKLDNVGDRVQLRLPDVNLVV